MPDETSGWYVIQTDEGRCEILPAEAVSPARREADPAIYGPYPTQEEAVARRVGLIRAGKCKPA
ncbi:MAG: hypothetical protein ACFCVD_00355 [Nodosilinea sp.]